jgi:hypothetical protein
MAAACGVAMLWSSAMHTEDHVSILQAGPPTNSGTARPEPVEGARPILGPFAALERLINTASFVSVDLTDTVAATLQQEREREARRYVNYLE